ncbi:hypothetical protein QJS04_geneDACA009710 [Acorus gramineus]|uniref:Uncharacterized protein n=1 Tax=Acorus gramineus TaxID=55184 RepID=A0AAV9BEI8_ACOGR|nr:hypothetical protein QJS04_geneDACA009710 [Acorus gramineus]
MAKKWRKAAASSRRRRSVSSISTSQSWGDHTHEEALVTTTTTCKGHFVVYTSDGSRFVIPLAYLKSEIIRELLDMSADEFGLPGDGPITLLCRAEFMDYVLWVLRRRVSKDVERSLLNSIATMRCWASSLVHLGHRFQDTVSNRVIRDRGIDDEEEGLNFHRSSWSVVQLIT